VLVTACSNRAPPGGHPGEREGALRHVAADDDVGDDDDLTPPEPPCVEGPDEANDDRWTATDGPDPGVPIEDVEVCGPEDEDWYRFAVAEGEVLSAEVLFDDEDGRLGVELVDSAGVVLAGGAPVPAGRRAWMEAAADGDYYVRIWLEVGEEPLEYHLATWACVDDALEDNDSPDQAVWLPPPVSVFDLGTCRPGEEDWFVLPGLMAGDLLKVRATFASWDGDVDLELFGPDDELLGAGTNTGPLETLVWLVQQDGDHLLRLWLAADPGVPGTSYDLDIDLGMPPGDCGSDLFEPNDDPAEPQPITSTLYEGLAICEGEQDWYEFEARGGDQIDVWVDFAHAEGDIDLSVVGPSGQLLVSSVSTDDDEDADFIAPIDGTYLALVDLVMDTGGVAGNLYNLSLQGPTDAPCVPDIYEPNDSPAEPWPTANGDYRDQTICPGDEDWYELWLGDCELLEVNIGTCLQAEGEVAVELLDEQENPVAGTSTANGSGAFVHDVVGTGRRLLRVWLVSDEGTIEGQVYDFGVLSIIQEECLPGS